MSENKEDKKFIDLVVGDSKLSDIEPIYSDEYDYIRLYFAETVCGFDAHAVDFISCDNNGHDDDDGHQWNHNNTIVNTIFEVTAHSDGDGVRHLEFNRNGGNQDGYLYYPKMQCLIDMLQMVRDLELKLCADCNGKINY